MSHHYVLWAFGADRPGIVSGITEVLFKNKCNLEDSSMMRLGSEFGVLLIFSSNKPLGRLRFPKGLNIGFKPIAAHLARFKPVKKTPLLTDQQFDNPAKPPTEETSGKTDRILRVPGPLG